jgi:hypothetical protein
MNNYSFRAALAVNTAEKLEGCQRVPGNAKNSEVKLHRGIFREEGFSLTIRSVDGRTLLDSHWKYLHQAFRRLIDWSIDDTGEDVFAVITGPNGFRTRHTIEGSLDFSWIEK